MTRQGRDRFGWAPDQPTGFNLTPIIDVVFLLIIFFMVVCQFIRSESFEVAVPDRIATAQDPDQVAARQSAVVTVMRRPDGTTAWAVGANILDVPKERLAEAVTQAVDRQLRSRPPDRRVVTLRCDKDATFADAKYALAGIGASTATDVRWAVIRRQRR